MSRTISLRVNSLEAVIQSAPPGQPATLGASNRFWPMDAKRLGRDAHQSGSMPVERMLPTIKSIGDLTIVARFSAAQKAFEVRIVLNSTLIS